MSTKFGFRRNAVFKTTAVLEATLEVSRAADAHHQKNFRFMNAHHSPDFGRKCFFTLDCHAAPDDVSGPVAMTPFLQALRLKNKGKDKNSLCAAFFLALIF